VLLFSPRKAALLVATEMKPPMNAYHGFEGLASNSRRDRQHQPDRRSPIVLRFGFHHPRSLAWFNGERPLTTLGWWHSQQPVSSRWIH
jgi:hypothetical protein